MMDKHAALKLPSPQPSGGMRPRERGGMMRIHQNEGMQLASGTAAHWAASGIARGQADEEIDEH